MTGNDHFNTFDNTGYRFLGACPSWLVLDIGISKDFSVVLNGDPNCHDINVKCQKTLDVFVDGVRVHLGAKTNTSFVVKVEGNLINLPHTSSDPIIKQVLMAMVIINFEKVAFLSLKTR